MLNNESASFRLALAGGAALALCMTSVYRQQQEIDKLEKLITSSKPQRLQPTHQSPQLDGTSSNTFATTNGVQGQDFNQRSTEEDHGSNAKEFIPHHISATSADMEGNGDVGRYFLLPGSNGRARVIADMFEHANAKGGVVVRKSGRGHDVYLGTVKTADGAGIVDVGVVATGMGCPSVDIVVTELIKLGAKRFIRVGTAGSLQPHTIRVGDVVIASAAVRDEGTSRHYAPIEFPAIAAPTMVQALQQAARDVRQESTNGNSSNNTYCGVVHTKDSLYAREFGEGAMVQGHETYMHGLKCMGVLASEMEAAHLFTLAHTHACGNSGDGGTGSGSGTGNPSTLAPITANGNGTASVGPGAVLCGAVLGIVGDDAPFADKSKQASAVQAAITLALQGVRVLHSMECGHGHENKTKASRIAPVAP